MKPAITRPHLRAVARATPVLFLFRLAAGFLVAYPFARILGSFGPSTSADDDRLLFVSGGEFLLEAARLGARSIGAALEAASIAGFGLSILGLFPLALAIGSMHEPRASLSELAGQALQRWPALVLLSGFALLVQAAVVAGTSALGDLVADALRGSLDERGADLCVLFIAFAGGSVVLAVGIVHDFGRCAIVRDGSTGYRAALSGMRSFADRPLSAVLGWVGPTAVGAALVAMAAWATSAIDVSQPGAHRIAAVFAVHQLAALGLTALRLVWLGTAMGLLGRPPSSACAELSPPQ